MRFALSFVLIMCLAGCGPLFLPMAPQLGPEDQRRVDQMWDNMLTPVQRVDRQTLLDANILFCMYAMGVDRMHMTSEKYFTGGMAIMEIDCDRANPDADQFTITVLDERGRTVRRERYSRADVDESARMLSGIPKLKATDMRSLGDGQDNLEPGQPTTEPATQAATQPVITLTPQERKFVQECERRRAAVVAATQPARLVPSGNKQAR